MFQAPQIWSTVYQKLTPYAPHQSLPQAKKLWSPPSENSSPPPPMFFLPPLEKKALCMGGGGLTFWIFFANSDQNVIKIFLANILGIWWLMRFFINLCHQTRGDWLWNTKNVSEGIAIEWHGYPPPHTQFFKSAPSARNFLI